MKRLIRRLIKLSLISALLGGALYLGTDAFARKWRGFVVRQMAERGLHLDFERLLFNPFGGLVAREVRVFSGADRQEVLAAVDGLNLDFDYGKLLEKKFVVEGLELRHARLALPVDIEGGATVLELRDLSARAFLRDGRLEVRHAEGVLSGVHLSISGELSLPSRPAGAPPRPALSAQVIQQRMQVLHNHQKRIQRGLDWLKRFEFRRQPRLSLQVHGAMDRPAELSARLFFEAEGLSYGGYVCRELLAEAEYAAGLVELTRLHLKDATGQVDASATWRMGAEDLRFRLSSSADLPRLAQAFLDSDNLREVVFYEAPQLALEGVWFVDGPRARSKRPVHASGRLEFGRFSSRGAVFSGLDANFGVAHEGVYIRDLLLRHETGTLSAQALAHDTEGFRYRAVLRMDPNAFLPFAKMEQTREIIRRFQFSPRSSIHLELEGQGPEPDLQLCRNRGRGELRQLSYRGVELELLEADIEFQDHEQHFRNVRIQRAEGSGEVRHVHVQDREKWVRLEGVRTQLDPVAVTSCFAPKTADYIARYRLPSTTAVELDGVIYYKDPSRSDFTVKFSHPEGPGHYVVLDEPLAISAPQGELNFKGWTLNFDIRGRVFQGGMRAQGSVDLSPETDDFSVTAQADVFPYKIFSKRVPFEKLKAEVSSRGGTMRFDIQSALLGGRFALQGSMNERQTPNPYTGELRLDEVSFQRFAQIYSKSNDTEGDITGHFRFAGKRNDWLSLKGGGAAIVLNGNLYAVPVLGPLTPLLGTVLPGQIKGYNVAKEANCTFEVADGYLITENFEALTSVFKITSAGRIDFMRDAVDLTAQVRFRGLPGLVFRPFSELLEYHGEGSVTDTQWRPSLLKGSKAAGRQPPSAEGMRAAERIAGEAPPPSPAPEPRRPPASMFDRPGGR